MRLRIRRWPSKFLPIAWPECASAAGARTLPTTLWSCRKGAIVPSAIETNIANAAAVKAAVTNVCQTLGAKDEDVALLVPDPVIRVFVQHFDDFPRSAEEAIPMLRWKLKKSVPFEVEETLLSYMRQAPRAEGVDVVTAIARLRIIKEYEAAAGRSVTAARSGAQHDAGGHHAAG